MNKKVIGVAAALLAIAWMSKKPPVRNNYLTLEVPEEVDEVLPDRNSPSDQDTPMSGYRRRTWINSL